MLSYLYQLILKLFRKEPTLEEVQERMRKKELLASTLEQEAILTERIAKANATIKKFRRG